MWRKRPRRGMHEMREMREEFIRFSLNAGALRFGKYRTKAGRDSPYFFNAGLFNDGATLAALSEFYARTLLDAGLAGRLTFDMLYGPAYKGIPLAAATAIALARHDCNLPFAFNRKEAKDHGEGGSLIGAPLAGKVVIIDDVISAGTSIRESFDVIRAAGAEPAGVLIALDRRERSGDAVNVGEFSAAQQVEREYGIPVVAIATIDDMLTFLDSGSEQASALEEYRHRIAEYRARYGVAAT